MRSILHKLISMMLVIALAFALLPVFVVTVYAYSSGSGTASDPYLISSTADLEGLRDAVNSGNNQIETYFKLTADVILSETWNPIGDVSNQFAGNLDGNGYTISGLKVNTSRSGAGLFGCVNINGSIKNLAVMATSVKTSYSSGGAGVIAGINAGAITNCFAIASTSDSAAGSAVGGIAGWNTGTIINCFASRNGTGTTYSGGLVGGNEGSGTLLYSYWNSSLMTNGWGKQTGLAVTGSVGRTAVNLQNQVFADLLNSNNPDDTVYWAFTSGYPTVKNVNTVSIAPINPKSYDKVPMALSVTTDYGTAVFEYFTDTNGTKGISLGSEAPVDAGSYWVTATVGDGANYLGAVSDAVNYTITPRIATFAWTQNHYFYTNAAHTVSARVNNLIPGDTCSVTLKNNTKTQIGEYTAEVVSLSNPNYTTDGTVEYHWSITDPDVSFEMGAVTHGYQVQSYIKPPPPPLYAVDITWGAMIFDYSTSAKWNTATHAYDSGVVGWKEEGFRSGNNKVTAYNHSNRDVIVSFEISENRMDDVDMNLYRSNTTSGQLATGITLGKVPLETSPATTVSAYLWLVGAPQDLNVLGSTAYAKVGIITVTVEATESDKTPTGIPAEEP